ncbi:MAG: MARVEL domain-containing protein [Thaumarchaeota archaeon]|nr:MARVEL domain-containing protein [Nitrososphaerota archaeon]
MASPGPPYHVHRHRGTSAFFFVAAVGAIILYVSLVHGWDNASFVLSLVSFLIIAYVIFTAFKAAMAQARRDRNEIQNAYALIRRCKATIKTIDRYLRVPDFELTYRLLDQLYDRVGLFVTQYGRYMHPDAADIVWEIENSVIKARRLQEGDLRRLMALLLERLAALHSCVLDADDPMLRDVRNRK